MKCPDNNNPKHPGPGWHPIAVGDHVKAGDVFYWATVGGWTPTGDAGEVFAPDLYFRFMGGNLSPEEQAVIDAMRAGRKVTVEAPKMPRRCWAPFVRTPRCDPWGAACPLSRDYCGSNEQVQLIELTPEVITALLAAGIRWEDAPTGNRLPEGLPPLPEGAAYLGKGGEFKTAGRFVGWTLRERSDLTGKWLGESKWDGITPYLHYAAPADSEIVKLNG